MNYKNTKELKDIFGIDITEKNRTIPYVAMRSFYAESKTNELKGNITSRYTKVANEIGCGRDNIYNLITKGKKFKTDECIKILFEAFKTKDKALISQYHKQVIKTRALNHSERNAKMFNDGHCYVQIPKGKEQTYIISNLKLAEYLRANKVLKHELWDTPVKNISPNQWQQAKKINPKMFEEIVNS
jgi:hypothetical protein